MESGSESEGYGVSTALARRRGRPLSVVPKRVEDMLLRRVAQQIGAEEFAGILLREPEGSKYAKLASLLTDLGRDQADLPSLAREADVDWQDVVKLFQTHQVQLAQIVAARGLPTIIADIVADSQNKVRLCDSCYGAGEVEFERVLDMHDADDEDASGVPTIEKKMLPCIPCDGTGYTVSKGDADARSMLLETLDLVKKKAATMNVFGSGAQINLGGQQAQFVTVGQKLQERMSEPPVRRAVIDVSAESAPVESGS